MLTRTNLLTEAASPTSSVRSQAKTHVGVPGDGCGTWRGGRGGGPSRPAWPGSCASASDSRPKKGGPGPCPTDARAYIWGPAHDSPRSSSIETQAASGRQLDPRGDAAALLRWRRGRAGQCGERVKGWRLRALRKWAARMLPPGTVRG